jgi:uncharacterized oxidoreductase
MLQGDAARKMLPGVHSIPSDVSDPAAIAKLYGQVVAEFPNLNMLINNAGIMRKINLHTFGSDLQDLTREINVDLNGAIRMAVEFLPHLKKQKSAAIVNVSSGLASVPLAISPVYCAAKAAPHSFTQSLRIQLKDTNVIVFELAPPITQTALFQGDISAEDVRVTPMDVKVLVQHAITGFAKGRLEIRPGLSSLLNIMSRVAPNFILRQLGKPDNRMLAQSKAGLARTPEI